MAVESKKLDKLESLYYDLDKKHALLAQNVDNIDKKTTTIGADVKTIGEIVSHLSVVSVADFKTRNKEVDDKIDEVIDSVDELRKALEELQRNSSFWTKLKTKVGERGLDMLVSVIIIVILFVIFITIGKPDAITNLFKG